MQYVEGLNGETARHSRVSALAAEASWIMRANTPTRQLHHNTAGQSWHYSVITPSPSIILLTIRSGLFIAFFYLISTVSENRRYLYETNNAT